MTAARRHCPGCLDAVLDQISTHETREQLNTLLAAIATVLDRDCSPAEGNALALGMGAALGIHLVRVRAENAIGPVQGHA